MVKLWLYLCASFCLSKPFSQFIAENLSFNLQDLGDCERCVLQRVVWIPGCYFMYSIGLSMMGCTGCGNVLHDFLMMW